MTNLNNIIEILQLKKNQNYPINNLGFIDKFELQKIYWR